MRAELLRLPAAPRRPRFRRRADMMASACFDEAMRQPAAERPTAKGAVAMYAIAA